MLTLKSFDMVSYEEYSCRGDPAYSRDSCILENVESMLLTKHDCTVPFMSFMVNFKSF